jgi:hypothetical protein
MDTPLPDAPHLAHEAMPFHGVSSTTPQDATLLALPDAQLCSLFRASLQKVWWWRAEVSRQHSPLFHPTNGTVPSTRAAKGFTSADVEGYRTEQREATTAAAQHRALQTAADLLHGRGFLHTAETLTLAHQLAQSTTSEASGVSSSADFTTTVVVAPASSSSPSTPCSPVLSTGLPTLDAATLGGLRRGWVTELTGLPSCGKTTLAASWCRHVLRCSAQGCDVVWLQSSAAVHTAVVSIGVEDNSVAEQRRCLQDALHVACLLDLDALQDLLQLWLGDPASLRTVGLVVLDSLSELVHRSFSYGGEDGLQRHDALASVLQALKRVAEERQVSVLLLSQQQQAPLPSRSSVSAEEDSDWTAAAAAPPLIGRGASASVEVGALGRLFFHSVNVRLRLREVCGADAAAFDSATFAFTASPTRTQWQLEVLKCPLCAPLAIVLQLRVSPLLPALGSTGAAGTATCSSLLSVVEGPGQDTVQPLRDTEDAGGELLYASIDPWDYTEIQTFVYM